MNAVHVHMKTHPGSTRTSAHPSPSPYVPEFGYQESAPAPSPQFSREESSGLDSRRATQMLSPVPASAEDGAAASQRSHLKRKVEDGSPVSLPGFHTLLAYDELASHASPEPSPLLTPCASPEPSEAVYASRRPSLFLAQDPITEKLNHLRLRENRNPLPPIQALYGQPPMPMYAHAHAHLQQQCQRSPGLQVSAKTRKRRAKAKDHPHCNIKYAVEELDYIRYQRMDVGQEWDAVEAKFHEKFPMVVFPEERQKQGLQGVIYRQNAILPRIVDGRLIFMENGHVEPVCVKTREQEEKHLYTLVNLFPERAMHYDWVTPKERQRARMIYHDRRAQKEQAVHEARMRGTYVETLEPPEACGCCPAPDRPRQKKQRKVEANKTIHVRGFPRYVFRARL
ncbi:hypothetical protein F5Y17DRAFT_469316 [Xylariaceae sp. FL0594]|nr:hypothetical protein F5Y17DRAFT_469316 [Xylariaceae sp. FL0594]